MNTTVTIFIGLAGLFFFIAIIWRFASRRHSLPCPVWLRWLVELDNPFTKTNRAEIIVGHLELEEGMAVLDAGCGPGRVTIPIARRVGKKGVVWAVDIQAGMLKRVRDKARNLNITNIQCVESAIGHGNLEVNQFDRAVLVTVLGEIPNRKAAIKEIHGALKSGGILSVTEIIFDPHFQRRKTVTRIAENLGFREVKFFGNKIAYTINFEKISGN